MTSIDTNVSNYTLSELLVILNLHDTETVDPDEVVDKTNKLITKFKNTNPSLAVFFKEVQSQVLQYAQGLMVERPENLDGKIVVEGFASRSNEAIYPVAEKQVTDWYENENLTQDNQNQVEKITQRKQKIQVFGNDHNPMKREQIATTDTFQLPVKQDSLNPNLKNTISRFVNLDSQFRQYTSGISSSSTDYTLDLSDTLKNALSLRLYSYQIPYSWYAIDYAYNNTCFWVIDVNSDNSFSVNIPPGNYSQTAFQTQLETSLITAGFSNGANMVNYNANSGIITLLFYDEEWIEPSNSSNTFIVSSSTMLLFYDFTGVYQCSSNTCYNVSSHYFNNTLGWLMGFRLPYVYVTSDGNSGGAILDLNGPKYLILVIDDYNQNHVNNSLVSISQFSNTLKMPFYYSPDLPYTCVSPAQQTTLMEQQGNSLSQIIGDVTAQSLFDYQTINPLNGLLIAGKYQQEYTTVQQVLPSAPRTLTQAQLYTINQISKNGSNITNYLSKAPTSSDILGVIPVKTSTGVPTGSLLVEFSGSLQDNVRTYFGPVNIERMAVKLLDDKGNVLNLNGNDWCVTLVCECLYQY
jgi:hypothetical protein